MGQDLKSTVRKMKKKPIQISWENIVISAEIKKGGCCGGKPKDGEPAVETKPIIRGVSGTVMPGQFLAIIGASGKYLNLYTISAKAQETHESEDS